MSFTNIANQQFAAAGTLVGTHRAHDLNYVVIGMDRAPEADDYLSISLEGKYHTRKILLNRVSCQILAAISDIRNGHSSRLQAALNAIMGTATTPAISSPWTAATTTSERASSASLPNSSRSLSTVK